MSETSRRSPTVRVFQRTNSHGHATHMTLTKSGNVKFFDFLKKIGSRFRHFDSDFAPFSKICWLQELLKSFLNLELKSKVSRRYPNVRAFQCTNSHDHNLRRRDQKILRFYDFLEKTSRLPFWISFFW